MSRLSRAAVPLVGLALLLTALLLPSSAQADPVRKAFYLSLGDSYAAGYQPGGMTTQGFANQTVRKARTYGYDLDLVNLACGGATTRSILARKGCAKELRPVGARGYRPLTQTQAATRFLRRHSGEVALVTVSIGGNDVTACGRGATDPISCVLAASQRITANVGTLMRKLRRAAGPDVTIIGTTYPDVLLGRWVLPPVDQSIAQLSVTAFRELINPALKAQYTGFGGHFVDVTAATGAYGSLERSTTLSPYGRIPVPVAKVCNLTWFCAKGDIHARTKGYGIIADLIVRKWQRTS